MYRGWVQFYILITGISEPIEETAKYFEKKRFFGIFKCVYLRCY